MSRDETLAWMAVHRPQAVPALEQVRGLAEALDTYYRARWARHVGFSEGVGDRHERSRRMGFGDGTTIYDSALVIGEVKIGRNTWVGPATVLDGSGGLVVGDFCSISAGAQLYSHDSVLWAVSGGDRPVEQRRTFVGSNTYVGPHAVIAAGVRVGDGCIIGANSLVRDDIPSGMVAVGNPARVVGTTKDYVDRRGGPASSRAQT